MTKRQSTHPPPAFSKRAPRSRRSDPISRIIAEFAAAAWLTGMTMREVQEAVNNMVWQLADAQSDRLKNSPFHREVVENVLRHQLRYTGDTDKPDYRLASRWVKKGLAAMRKENWTDEDKVLEEARRRSPKAAMTLWVSLLQSRLAEESGRPRPTLQH